MTDTKLLFDSIVDSIVKIEEELKPLGKGIFFAPELYISFRIGFDKYQNRDKIFNTLDVEWIREKRYIKGSISDFAFEIGKERIIFEIKIRSTSHKYISDLQKLQSIDNTSTKCFIALVYHFVNRPDGRIEKVKSSIDCISDHRQHPLPTEYRSSKRPINCMIHFFQLKSHN